MPTNQDETLQQRYARDHQDYLKLCGSMTAEQVADLQLQLNNSLSREAALTAVKIGIDDREAGISQEAYQIFLERDGVRLRQIEDERANFKTLNREAVALREELATLRESYESMRDRKNSIVDLQQRLTIAEQRNAELVELLREVLPSLNLAANAFKSVKLIRNKVRAALKPTESGAIHE